MRKVILTLLVAFAFVMNAAAQDRTITGRIVDEKGAPISGVSVTSSDGKGTTTKADGTYSITVGPNAKTLAFSGVSYDVQTKAIGTQKTINLAFTARNKQLDEVVVTGYTVKKKAEFTGAAAKVAAKQIEQVPIASFEQILQGRAPGLYIASGSGQPGTAARVNIRGVGSIGGSNDPLYVLDGIPIETSVFRSLNPNDFESVDVLKDAASAGQYGSRGANGVIVITSKKGKVGKTLLQYRGQVGFSQAPSQNNLRLMNTAERLRYEGEFLGPAGVLGTGTATGYPGWDYSPNNPAYQSSTPAQQAVFNRLLDSTSKINTNWADIFFRNSTFRQHELSASGGGNGINFFTSLSAYKQEGIIIRSNLDRYTFRGNLDFKSDRLTVSVRSFSGYSNSRGIESEAGVALANPVAAAYLELPYRQLRNSAGAVDVGAGKTGPNAFDRSNTTTSNSGQFKGTLGVTLQYNIWKGLSFKTTNGIDYRNNNQSRYIDPNSFAGSNVNPGGQGSYNESFVEVLGLISTTGFVYNKTFASKHQVNAQLLSESIRNRARTFGATGFGLNRSLGATPVAITPGSAANGLIPAITGQRNAVSNGLSSLFFIGDYTYNKKYTFSASIRRDVASQASPGNREVVLPSFGASWNLMEEGFMKKQNILQDARVRASYGESANIGGFPGDFNYLPGYGPGSYAGATGIVPTSPGNPDYKTETQKLTNIGFDLSTWNRRLRISADAYLKQSNDLFITQNLSLITGFTALNTNAGKMENRGIDFKVDVDVLSKKDLLVTVGINGGFLRNRITSLGALSDIPQGTGILRVGLPLGTHYTVGFNGVNPQSGLPVYQDINGNPTTDYNASNSRASFGTFLPTFTGGASLDVTWKGFDLSALLSTAQGVKRFNNEAFFYETTNSNVAFNKSVELLNSWRNPGEQTIYQKINSQRQFSSRDIEDASFVRLRNVQIGYTFTTKAGKPIRGFRIFGQAQNLYTWTKWRGFDPEESNNIASYEFPNPKTYTFGLDINF